MSVFLALESTARSRLRYRASGVGGATIHQILPDAHSSAHLTAWMAGQKTWRRRARTSVSAFIAAFKGAVGYTLGRL
jgi:hypothetical protein